MTDNTNPLNPVTLLQAGAVLSAANPVPTQATPALPSTVTAIAGNATGTTGAVVGTLTATSNTTAYISGFSVSAAGTGSVGPITVAGLAGGSQVYSLTAPGTLSVNFAQAIPASAVNTNITVTTTADASATAVQVNSWGFRL